MSTDLVIIRDIDGYPVGQRRIDGYINATAMCKAANKRWNHYTSVEATTKFFAELSAVTGLPVTVLAQSKYGGHPTDQGTWVHPQAAIHLAMWCSPKFSVIVTAWIQELLTTGKVEIENSSGDPLLDSIETLQKAVSSIAENRRRQLALEKAQRDLEKSLGETKKLAEHADRTAQAALDITRNNHGYMQVLGWAKLVGRELTEQQASVHGKAVSRICRERGLNIDRQWHERYGYVNKYPCSVLREYFGDPDDPEAPSMID